MPADPQDAEFLLTHQPCPCGRSSDAFAISSNGWGKCFSCGKNCKMTDEAMETMEATPALVATAHGLIHDLEIKALAGRKLTLETCRKFGYGVGTNAKGQRVQVAPYVKDGAVVGQKTRTAGKEFAWTGDAKNPPLFGQHLWGSK